MVEALAVLEAQAAQGAVPLGGVVVVGEDHASFACGDVLVGVEAKGADRAEAAAGTAVAGLSDGFCGIR